MIGLKNGDSKVLFGGPMTGQHFEEKKNIVSYVGQQGEVDFFNQMT